MKLNIDLIENSCGNHFITMPNGSIIIEVPLVPFSAYASFIEAFDHEYTVKKEFETTYFVVDKIGRGRYIAFTVTNEGMNGWGLYDTPCGSQVLARELGKQHWKDGVRSTKYGWVIISSKGIFHKDIYKFNKETGDIICSSRNPLKEFPDFILNLNEVHSIYKVIKRSF